MSKILIVEDDEKYEKPGVWALWAKDESENYICLEVGQTQNMLKEINENIKILRIADSQKCIECDEIYPARKRYKYSQDFQIHKCKDCKEKSSLRKKYALTNARRVDKYKDMLTKYKEFEFRIVDNSTDKNCKEMKQIEKMYAQEHNALYWFS